jgi:hypothetical protein
MQPFTQPVRNYQSGIDFKIGTRSGRITDPIVLATFYTRINYGINYRRQCTDHRDQGPSAIGRARQALDHAYRAIFRFYQKARNALSDRPINGGKSQDHE